MYSSNVDDVTAMVTVINIYHYGADDFDDEGT